MPNNSAARKKKPDPKIDEESLKLIQAAAHKLFETVKRADTNWYLKQFTLSLTSAILQGIQQYRIGGPEGLKRTVSLIIGQAMLNIGMVGKARSAAHTKSLWSRFYKIAVKFYEVVKFASDTRKTITIISPFVRLLGGRHDEIPPVDLSGPDKLN